MGYFEASHLTTECGQMRPIYQEVALSIAHYLLDHQQSSGGWIHGLSEADYVSFTGRVNNSQPTSGSYFTPVLISAFEVTNDTIFLDAARSAYLRYLRDLKTNGFTSSFPLNGRVADCESATPLLYAALKLYQISKNKTFIDDAVLISYYLSTWLWHYDSLWPVKDILCGEAHTLGLARPTSRHQTLDVLPCRWIPAWQELSRLTGDKQWNEKAQVIWNAATQPVILSATRDKADAWAIATRLKALRKNSQDYFTKKQIIK